jgi:hypothetical protein
MTTQMLKDAGFHDVIAEDRTEQVISIPQSSLVVEQFITCFLCVILVEVEKMNRRGRIYLFF